MYGDGLLMVVSWVCEKDGGDDVVVVIVISRVCRTAANINVWRRQANKTITTKKETHSNGKNCRLSSVRRRRRIRVSGRRSVSWRTSGGLIVERLRVFSAFSTSSSSSSRSRTDAWLNVHGTAAETTVAINLNSRRRVCRRLHPPWWRAWRVTTTTKRATRHATTLLFLFFFYTVFYAPKHAGVLLVADSTVEYRDRLPPMAQSHFPFFQPIGWKPTLHLHTIRFSNGNVIDLYYVVTVRLGPAVW